MLITHGDEFNPRLQSDLQSVHIQRGYSGLIIASVISAAYYPDVRQDREMLATSGIIRTIRRGMIRSNVAYKNLSNKEIGGAGEIFFSRAVLEGQFGIVNYGQGGRH